MPLISVRIPQIGEGLQEARLVAMLKNPGDHVQRDEPIYQMETDKAVMDVESPYEGVLVEWLAEADAILAIGSEVARMDVVGEAQEMVVHGASNTVTKDSSSEVDSGTRNVGVPPRTRAYAKEKGLTDDELAQLIAASSKLMPADIDAYLESKPGAGGEAYSEVALSQKQRLLGARLQRGSQLVVPGTMSVPLNWGPVERVRERVKSHGGDFKPSAFTMFAFAVAQTLKDFPAFRSSLIGDDRMRTYHHASIGIAVGLPGDELVLAVVHDADSLTWREFADAMRQKIDLARAGKDQANESVTLSLTNMQSHGIRDAVAVVVPPAVATLFLGAVYNGIGDEIDNPQPKRLANMGLTFDHRLINGVGAAEFMKSVKRRVETIDSILV